jgi:hypothetical protein
LVTYLTVTNIGNNVVRITVIHSIAWYSAGFGGSNALHGQTLALLGETVGNQLPMLVKFMEDSAEDLPHALAMEAIVVPSEVQVATYFVNPVAENLLPGAPVAQGGVTMNLSNMCPIPLVWAPYFLDFKTPHAALQMGHALIATLGTVAHRTQAAPLLDWLRATWLRLGPNAADRQRSLLDQGFEPTAPDARVVKWMQKKLAAYRLPTIARRRISCKRYNYTRGTDISRGVASPRQGKRIFTTGEGPNPSSLWFNGCAVGYRPPPVIHVYAGRGFNNDMSYDSCHRGISPFTVIGVSMATASKP